VPRDGDWIWELKYDGFRIIAKVEKGVARLVTRNGNNFTVKFSKVAKMLEDLPDCVLDGELVMIDEHGKCIFPPNAKSPNLNFIIFDILSLKGKDLRGLPLIERKQILLKLGPPNLIDFVRGGGEDAFTAACRVGHEGLVGKQVLSIYTGKRDGSWIKVQCKGYKRI